MSSIGPQLPPSLSKRKRGDEDDSAPDPSSPRPKQARPNSEEIDLSSSDDDDFGPRSAPAPRSAAPVAGPTLPSNTDEINIDGSDSDESDTGPAPPPSIGPTRPSAAAAVPKDDDSDSDSDDYGPALPSSKPKIGPSLPPSATDTSSGPQAPQRDDWMLAPPTSSAGYAERDPSKLRARKFASKPSSGGSKADAEISSIWTETPEEKLKRLQDSVLGRSSGAGSTKQSASAAAAEKKSREDAERDRRIAENIERSKKGKSLVEEHQERRREKGHKVEDDDDDPSKRAFDREKDMAIGGRMGGKERREMMTQAKGFSGRFQKGSYL
ncbi:hypothetical protein NLU13_8146 [Sarocladium strictum]|uniref:DUF3752 domain-containing protein n=1 Tax=Sarocladium strictum TaxID=5046 RepID=A0AA39GDF0_SARSR|nr:hypothetical protein NLU13_8146 [Sarocladium strictum]